MSGISFIVERKVICKILIHLTLWLGNEIRGSPHWPGKGGAAPTLPKQEERYEPVDDGWPGYDEPVYGDD